MLDVVGSIHESSDLRRRDVLRIGALAAGGVTLPGFLRHQALARAAGREVKDLAVIHVFQGGGPSHIDMYDLKPGAPREIRGKYSEIPTRVPGLRISEMLPLQASIMDKVALVRSVTHTNSAHLPSSHLVLTGYETPNSPPDNMNPYPGAVISKLKGANASGVPAYVAVHKRISYGGSAYLGPAHAAFDTVKEPKNDDFAVPDLQRLPSMSAERLASRRSLLRAFDQMRRDIDVRGNMDAIDDHLREAMKLVTSDRVLNAFDINQEDPATRARYGFSSSGQNCLLARRLVEAGVTFVSCRTGLAWDTHVRNYPQLDEMLPKYDAAISALVTDIYERGLADRVLVMAFGEFGRTPRINKDGGRDHWPGAASVLFSGGGLKVGQVIGATDSTASFPTHDPHSPRDVLATLYHLMGIDPAQTFRDGNNRDFAILPGGDPIKELL